MITPQTCKLNRCLGPLKDVRQALTQLKRAFVILLLVCAGPAIANAQTFTSLLSFNGANGAFPQASLVRGADGNFYSTTPYGGGTNGEGGCGNVFELSASGKPTTVYDFDCTDGEQPYSGVIRGRDGNFYGVTAFGGSNGKGGTIFEVTVRGKLTTLYNFCSQPNCSDGSTPYAELMQAFDGDFYGTTSAGGVNGTGTVFKITPEGKLTTLYSFCSKTNCEDGSTPFAGLMQGFDGNFYGTTAMGGTNNQGTVFEITPSGKLTTLHNFCSAANCADGATPYAALMLASNGRFYGTTYSGGTYDKGTIFKITPAGRLTTLHSFNGRDGASPYIASLVEGVDGNFYGTTYTGGANTTYGYGGTIFKITPWGKLTSLYSFCALSNCADGRGPVGGLTLGIDGILYGTTFSGGLYGASECGVYGSFGCGTFFSLKVERWPSEQ
jgi:uncharacterized repeat protein (TIGR03803 family)